MPSPATSNPFSLGVVLLAAGASSRMGRPKLLLRWGDTSVIGHLVEQWKKIGAAQITVVCAAGDRGVASELDRLRFSSEDRIFNPSPERGMFSSIQCAAGWTGWCLGLTHWALVLGDQPHLSSGTLRALVEFAAAHSQQICLPFQGGHRRHPVVLPETAFRRLKTSTVPDLKQFLNSENLALCEMADPGLDLDMDRPEDYERAIRLSRQFEGRLNGRA